MKHDMLGSRTATLLVLATLAGGCATLPASDSATAEPTDGAVADVSSALDRFHRAAAEADIDTYAALLAPEAVFLGTDASERWPRNAFLAFARPRFAAGRGWAYATTERHVHVADDGQTAWFDELLHNERLGQCRGSGVLRRTGTGWQVAQYNLSIPIPNPLADEFAARIRNPDG